MRDNAVAVLACALALCGCATRSPTQVAVGEAAYETLNANAAPVDTMYRIGPFDKLTISVFGEPGLSFTDIPVDAQGQFEYPLIGTVSAQGRTAPELRDEIKRRLDARYYNDSNVTVFISSSARQFVTVEGSVTEPGRYELPNGTGSLIEVMALAKSPTRTAALDEVIVFREVNGQRTGARFDLGAIRRGAAPNPQIRSGDVVVVGFSQLKGGFRDFLQAVPILNIFRPF